MANVTVIPQVSSSTNTQLRYIAEQLLDEPLPLAATTSNSAPTSQRVYGMLVGLAVGTTVTGVQIRIATAAVGTAPTLARFGLADATGKIVARSADLGAATNWPIGPASMPFTPAYPVQSAGGYYICFVVNGAWSVTQPLLAGTAFAAVGSAGAAGSAAAPFFTWDTQADLPAVGASLTMTASAAVRYMAPY